MKFARMLRIISRRSRLAQWQAHYVKEQLQAYYPDAQFQMVTRITRGDVTRSALQDLGGKGLFVKELQQAVLDHDADIAVHSLKDMSVHPMPGLSMVACMKREDPRDVLLSRTRDLCANMHEGAVIGTASPRRSCQLKALREDFKIKLLRGNVESRLKQLDAGDYDGIVLAAAGVKRLGLMHRVDDYFNPLQFIPAMGQGVIAVECRVEDEGLQQKLLVLDDLSTRVCVTAERAMNRALGGDCFTPIGAYAELQADVLYLVGMLGSLEHAGIVRGQVEGAASQAEVLGLELGHQLGREMLSS